MNNIKLSLIFILILSMTAVAAVANDRWKETPDVRSEISDFGANSMSDSDTLSGNQRTQIEIWTETPDLETQERVDDRFSNRERARTCTANPELYQITPDVNRLELAGTYHESICY